MLGFLPQLWPQGPCLVLCAAPVSTCAALLGFWLDVGKEKSSGLPPAAARDADCLGIIPRQPGQPGAWPAHLAPAALGPQCRVGVLLHSTDPPGSLISDTQPESTHCHKHNEFLGESTEGCSGPRFPTDPCYQRPAASPLPPLPCCSAPASAQPSGSGEGFPEASWAVLFTQGTPTQPATVRVEACGGPVPSRGEGPRVALGRISLGLQLPSSGAGLGRSPVAATHSWPDQTICLFKFLVLLRDELPRFPSGNTSFQQAVGSRGPGQAGVGLLVWLKSCWMVSCPSVPYSLNPFSQPALPALHLLS